MKLGILILSFCLSGALALPVSGVNDELPIQANLNDAKITPDVAGIGKGDVTSNIDQQGAVNVEEKQDDYQGTEENPKLHKVTFDKGEQNADALETNKDATIETTNLNKEADILGNSKESSNLDNEYISIPGMGKVRWDDYWDWQSWPQATYDTTNDPQWSDFKQPGGYLHDVSQAQLSLYDYFYDDTSSAGLDNQLKDVAKNAARIVQKGQEGQPKHTRQRRDISFNELLKHLNKDDGQDTTNDFYPPDNFHIYEATRPSSDEDKYFNDLASDQFDSDPDPKPDIYWDGTVNAILYKDEPGLFLPLTKLDNTVQSKRAWYIPGIPPPGMRKRERSSHGYWDTFLQPKRQYDREYDRVFDLARSLGDREMGYYKKK